MGLDQQGRDELSGLIYGLVIGLPIAVSSVSLGVIVGVLGSGPNDPSVPAWGRMLGESQGLLATSPRLVLLPGVAIVVWVLAFNLLGEAHRDARDPKLDDAVI